MAGLELRPRSGTELIDASFNFVRANYGPLLGIVALAQLPVAAGSLFMPVAPDEVMKFWTTHIPQVVVFYVLAIWIWAIMGCAFVLMTSDLIEGRSPSISSALSRALRRGAAAGVLLLLKYLVIWLWAILFLLPALWAFARYFAVMPALAIEGRGPLAAIRRSKELARGANGRVMAVAGLPLVAYLVLANIIQQTLLTLGGYSVLVRAIATLSTTLLYPFAVMPGILLYYDLRIRREGLDFQLDASLPTAAA
jgi:hypothetical protein